jgi:deoxyribonuclease V
MRVRELHRWDVSPEEARAIQEDLASRLVLEPAISLDEVKLVAGIDDGYVRQATGELAFAAVVVLSFPELAVVETATASAPVTFPYVPGFLSFREAPAMLAAIRQLAHEPDLWLFDGHGYAHPRRIGIASHMGLILDRPSVGCAKSRLVGRWDEPGPDFGDRSPIVDRGEVVGMAVRTRPAHAPLLVSPGHKLDVESAAEFALACCREERFLPEPTRLAHDLVTATTKPFRRPRRS